MSRNPTGRTTVEKDFDKLLRSLDSHQLWQVFSDFCELGALAFENVMGPVHPRWQEREDQYLAIMKRYSPDEARVFPYLLALATQAMDRDPQDFLGQAFMRLELSSHWHGQFFTPFDIAAAMAQITLGDKQSLAADLERKGFMSALDPAVGAGCLPIALAEQMRAMGFNPQQQLFLEVWDVDRTAAHMAMVQLSMLHIPAEIVVGNSLSLQVRDRFNTPAYHLGLWSSRRHRNVEAAPDPEGLSQDGRIDQHKPLIAPVATKQPPDIKLGQLSMFDEEVA